MNLGACPVTITGDTTCATDSYMFSESADGGAVGVCSGPSPGNDLVYAVTPVSSGTLTATLTPIFGKPLIEIREGCPPDPSTLVACYGNLAGVVQTSMSVQASVVYYVVVDSFGSGDNGPFTLTLTLN